MAATGFEQDRAEELKDRAALSAASEDQPEESSDTEEIPSEEQSPEEKMPDDVVQDPGDQPE